MPTDIRQHLSIFQEIQTIDQRLRQVDRQLNEIEIQLGTAGTDYFAISKALQEKETLLSTITADRQGLETTSKEQNELVQEKDKKVFSIKTQKEYQSALKEIAKIKQENKEREDRVLSLLNQSEVLNAEITQLKSDIADKESSYKQVEGELSGKRESLVVEKKTLSEKRPTLLEGLPKEILKKYDAMKTRFTDPIASVKRGVCQGCSMNIPAQFYNDMLKAQDLKHCPNCNRLIYAETENK